MAKKSKAVKSSKHGKELHAGKHQESVKPLSAAGKHITTGNLHVR